MNDGGDGRTAPATPDLLIIVDRTSINFRYEPTNLEKKNTVFKKEMNLWQNMYTYTYTYTFHVLLTKYFFWVKYVLYEWVST